MERAEFIKKTTCTLTQACFEGKIHQFLDEFVGELFKRFPEGSPVEVKERYLREKV